MASLTEMFGAVGTTLFVPASVIDSQKQNQIDLQARADRINQNAPEIVKTASAGGVLSDGQAKSSLQQMNASLFLVDASDRMLGEQIVKDVVDSAAAAPKTLINYTNDNIVQPTARTIGQTVNAIVPWQLWLILGVVALAGVSIFAYVKGKT